MEDVLQSRTLPHQCGDVTLLGELYVPEGTGPFPGVLVMPDARGIGGLSKTSAARLARLGYVALATDPYGDGLFHGGEKSVELQQDLDLMHARNAAALTALLSEPKVDSDRIGAIGYCFGGQTAFELARSGADLKCAVSFHGLLSTTRPARKGAIKGELLAIIGLHDPYAPPVHTEAFQAEMIAAEAHWQTTIYGNGWHQFTDPNGERDMPHVPGLRYDPLLARLSWEAALSLLNATLKPDE